MRSENEGYEPVYTGKEAHRKWRARQEDHPRHEGDECSGEEKERGDDVAGRKVERWMTRKKRRKVGRVASVVYQEEWDPSEEEVEEEEHEAQRERCREE